MHGINSAQCKQATSERLALQQEPVDMRLYLIQPEQVLDLLCRFPVSCRQWCRSACQSGWSLSTSASSRRPRRNSTTPCSSCSPLVRNNVCFGSGHDS